MVRNSHAGFPDDDANAIKTAGEKYQPAHQKPGNLDEDDDDRRCLEANEFI